MLLDVKGSLTNGFLGAPLSLFPRHARPAVHWYMVSFAFLQFRFRTLIERAAYDHLKRLLSKQRLMFACIRSLLLLARLFIFGWTVPRFLILSTQHGSSEGGHTPQGRRVAGIALPCPDGGEDEKKHQSISQMDSGCRKTVRSSNRLPGETHCTRASSQSYYRSVRTLILAKLQVEPFQIPP